MDETPQNPQDQNPAGGGFGAPAPGGAPDAGDQEVPSVPPVPPAPEEGGEEGGDAQVPDAGGEEAPSEDQQV